MLIKFIKVFKERLRRASLADDMAKEATQELIPLKEKITISNFELSNDELNCLTRKELLSFQRAKTGIEDIPVFASKLISEKSFQKEIEYKKKYKEWRLAYTNAYFQALANIERSCAE